MKCVQCETNLTPSMPHITLSENKHACLNCFFKGIPSAPSKMDVNYEQQKLERDQAIEKRVKEFQEL